MLTQQEILDEILKELKELNNLFEADSVTGNVTSTEWMEVLNFNAGKFVETHFYIKNLDLNNILEYKVEARIKSIVHEISWGDGSPVRLSAGNFKQLILRQPRTSIVISMRCYKSGESAKYQIDYAGSKVASTS